MNAVETGHHDIGQVGSVVNSSTERGFTLLEMVITMAVLTILTMGVLPLVKLSVRRQKEAELRATLRDMRRAIEEFHRDTIGGPCDGASAAQGNAGGPRPQAQLPNAAPGNAGTADPRSRVVISDCKAFKSDNPDRFPPDLETLVSGINVIPRGNGAGGGRGELGVNATDVSDGGAALSTKKKIYLRKLPVDPITGESEWDLRSVYQDKDASSWDELNVFDVRSKADGEALDGTKYSDW
ncbi:MAG: type II secretion system protein [Pyrinomonadaceae bacterium]